MSAGEGLAAALLQISQHAERIGLLDAREGEHFQAVSESLGTLHVTLDGLQGTVTGHSEVLASLDGLAGDVTSLAAQVASLLPPAEEPGERYRPIPTVQWWALPEQDRDKALARIRGWITEIYRPFYGHLAGRLGDCWEQHPLCLVTLDWLSELWSVLELQPDRTARNLAEQAELGTRIIPAISEQLAAETSGCQHTRGLGRAAAGAWSR